MKLNLLISQIEEIISLYIDGRTSYEIAESFKISPSTVQRLLKINNIKLRKNIRIFTAEQKNEIIALYNSGTFIQDISVKFHCRLKYITGILKNNNIKITRTSYRVNENIFNLIDSEQKAYYLGFLYRKGPDETGNVAIDLRLAIDDIDDEIYLQNFAAFISNMPFEKLEIFNEKAPTSNYYRLRLHNLNLANSLREQGCRISKNCNELFPEYITENLIKDFIRGYFEKNGGIYISSSNGAYICICGNEIFLNKIKDILFKNINIKVKINGRKNCDSKILIISDIFHSFQFLDWIYKNSNIKRPSYFKKFINNTPEQIYKNFREYKNNKKKEKMKDPIFRLKQTVSSHIRRQLFINGSAKNNKSCSKYLEFTPEVLKNYIESIFEPWMNWNNYGSYNSNDWDDDDCTTWKWSLDHIIPQSDLPYSSMDHENFKKCWALNNLRPYNAKLNLLDGISGIRHKNHS